MKFPTLFRTSAGAQLSRSTQAQAQAEKLLVESFRMLGQVCVKMADYLESQRLARAGFESQGKFLERLEKAPTREPIEKLKL